MTDIEDLNPTGVSRRRLLVRGAVLGGVAWAAPQVTTVAGAQVAASPADTNISFIALLLSCGGQTFRIKFNEENGVFGAPETGDSFSLGNCAAGANPQLQAPNIQPGLPAGTWNVVLNADGSATITTDSGCTVIDYVVKCGTCCDQQSAGERPPITFPATIGQCANNQCGDSSD